MVRISLVPYSANLGQVHKLPKNRPIDSIDVNRLRKNEVTHFINMIGKTLTAIAMATRMMFEFRVPTVFAIYPT